MIEGNRPNVWRPPKLFTVYQNACKQKTTDADKAACQLEFEKVFTCTTAATAIAEVPTGCDTNPAVTCTTDPVAQTSALNHAGCSFKCDAVAHLSTATYADCVTTTKAAALAITSHEVPGKKDDNPYFCCNKKIEATLFNNWETWGTCEFAEPTTCDPSNPAATCKNHFSAAQTGATPPAGTSFE